jgi:hypothetical protein
VCKEYKRKKFERIGKWRRRGERNKMMKIKTCQTCLLEVLLLFAAVEDVELSPAQGWKRRRQYDRISAAGHLEEQ